VAVSNVDAQMRQKEAMARLQEEQTTYARIKALTQGFICIYTVDPVTGHFLEYSAAREYEGLDIEKAGDDFWAASQKNSIKHIFPEDIEKFQTLMTREKVMSEIEQHGLFTMQYRMFLNDEPKYITLQAALVEEKDGPQLIIAVNNVDDMVRREQDYERKLAAARSRANLDTLTGVKNRTAYDNMSQTLAHQIELGQTVRYAIALCRVKDLPEINEAQGHEVGDQLLRDACALICNTFKHSPVFRVAGDQFAAIAQGHDYEFADDLVAELEANGRSSNVPVVCGMAKYEGSGSVASVFARADALCHQQ
jgi:diguanylate cyclase (GGDEF)-like protein